MKRIETNQEHVVILKFSCHTADHSSGPGYDFIISLIRPRAFVLNRTLKNEMRVSLIATVT
jgi:hypothetical protein